MHIGTSFYSEKELRQFRFRSIGKNVFIKKNVGLYFIENISIGNNVRIDDNVIIVASNKKNPVTGAKCKEAFVSGGVSENAESVEMPDDILAQLYFAGLGVLGVYILHRFMEKTR